MLFFTACTQEDLIVEQPLIEQQNSNSMKRIWGGENLTNDRYVCKRIAQKLALTDIPCYVVKDVHQIIQNCLAVGLTEACYIKEVYMDSVKMWLPETTRTHNFFKNTLKFSPQSQTNDSIQISTNLLETVQIYWPYSENWDGKTIPVITWIGERYGEFYNYAYYYDNGALKQTIVDDIYMQHNPVWVINLSKYPHSCFPKIVSTTRGVNFESIENNLQVDANGMIMQFLIPKYSDDGSTSGSSSSIYIDDENEINLKNGHKVLIGNIKIEQQQSYYVDTPIEFSSNCAFINNNYELNEKN